MEDGQSQAPDSNAIMVIGELKLRYNLKQANEDAVVWQNTTIACLNNYYNMTVWILVGYYISFTIAAGLIRLHMPGVKKSCV